MLRRRVTFEEPEGEGPEEPPRKRRAVAVGGPGSRFPAQPSLDSDEEEEEEEEEEQREEGPPVEGQEPGPAPGVGEGPVPLTPFNLEEELGEGRFDPHGHFLPRPQREPPDPWLEQIQGGGVAKGGGARGRGWSRSRGCPSSPGPSPRGTLPPPPPSPPPLPHLLGEVLELLRPGETVGAALRRWGGAGRPAGRGRGRGRARAPPPPELEALVALSDALVARGVLGVFGESRERLQARLRELREGPGHAPRSPGHAPAAAQGEGPQEEEEEQKEEGEGQSSGPAPLDMFAPPEEEGEGREALPEVLWEYHWGGEGQGDGHAPPELFGPFSSAQMQEWAAQGYFQGGGGARCRRVDPPNPPGPFYDCGRVDFQLYT
ncbi:CD2 antigen cytoplasmic tail-binding protein 2-like [Agelaius tricolor]|uniref:CD2 antigen cytoplasmic tail-binding protein 2-like n=1 Tax=Agelaius tricolor TaxID=9191 RepID=UPI0039F1B308